MIKKANLDVLKLNPIKYANKLSIDELVKLMKKMADAYYNTGKPLVSDKIYDELRDVLEEREPNNAYLKEVGAPIKGTKEKVILPFPMGSLAKVKPNSGTLDKWVAKYKGPYVLSDKMDGASMQMYKDNLGNLMLYSRGHQKDTTTNIQKGQNISHLLPYITKNIKLNEIPNGTSIRGELIMSKKDFSKMVGKEDDIKNARNIISGLVNAKTVDPKLASVAQFVAYSILSPRYEQDKQMKYLEGWGFTVPTYKIVNKLDENILTAWLKERKSKSEFDIDGIVCVDNSAIHAHEMGNPDYAFAFKIILDEQISETTVVDVIWTPSMDGYLKPVIKIEPVKMGGTVNTFATAFNAKYIVDNVIGVGSKIKLIRSGEIIPYILEVMSQSTSGKPLMPDVPYHWNETKVDIIVSGTKNKSNEMTQIIQTKLLKHFFKIMDIKYLSEGIIAKLVENGYDTVAKILSAKHSKLITIDGIGDKMVKKIYGEIDRAFAEVPLHIFMAASHKFGRNLGRKKLYNIVKAYPNILSQGWDKKTMNNNITSLHGFEAKTAKLFADNFETFMEFFTELNKIKDLSRFNNVEVDSESDSDGSNSSDDSDDCNEFKDKSVVFTGFRDKNYEAYITKCGGNVTTSVSKNTYMLVHANGDNTSSKYVKAKELGIMMIDNDGFAKKYM